MLIILEKDFQLHTVHAARRIDFVHSKLSAVFNGLTVGCGAARKRSDTADYQCIGVLARTFVIAAARLTAPRKCAHSKNCSKSQ